MHFTEYDTRLAAYAILTDENARVLLTWFNGGARAQPCWSLPGGRVDRRPFRSQQFILAATITGGNLGTIETNGTTDCARWVPIAEVARLSREPMSSISR